MSKERSVRVNTRSKVHLNKRQVLPEPEYTAVVRVCMPILAWSWASFIGGLNTPVCFVKVYCAIAQWFEVCLCCIVLTWVLFPRVIYIIVSTFVFVDNSYCRG